MSKSDVVVLLNGVEATGAGAAQYLSCGAPYTVQVVFTNSGGSVTALVVQLESSLDGVNFVSLHDSGTPYTFSAGELTAKTALFHIANKGAATVRGNITTLTETGTTSVSMYVKGS